MHYTLSAFLLTLVLSKAHAGPFGLSAGMSLAEVRKLGFVKPDGPYTYTVERLTTGYREFTSYGLLLTPQLGFLSRVRAR